MLRVDLGRRPLRFGVLSLGEPESWECLRVLVYRDRKRDGPSQLGSLTPGEGPQREGRPLKHSAEESVSIAK